MTQNIRCIRNIGSYSWGEQSGRKLEYIKWGGLPEDYLEQRRLKGRNFVDRESDKIIIVFFQSGAGGLFLSNCLSLSSSVCSPHSLKEKVRLWDKYLDKQNKFFWNDLYLSTIPEIGNIAQSGVSSTGYYGNFFMFEHEPENIQLHYDFWTNNPSMIYFRNSDLFCKIRRVMKNIDGNFKFKSYEKLVPDLIKYPIPKTFSQFFNFSKEKQEEYIHVYKRYKLKYAGIGDMATFEPPAGPNYVNGKLFYIWDTNWFFSETETINRLRELYEVFEYDDFHEKILSFFYKKWMGKLNEKCEQVPENMVLMPKLVENLKNFDKAITDFRDLD